MLLTPLMLTSDNYGNMDGIEFYVDLAKAVEASEGDSNADATRTTRIEVLKTGDWNTSQGKFSITPQMLQDFSDHFYDDVRPHSSTAGLPIDEEHEKKHAIGWLHAPKVEANDRGGQTLFMDAKWTRRGWEMVKDKTYQFFSPEVHFEHTDPEGKFPKLRNVLMGGAATNRPLFKGLAGIPALTANDGTADEDNKIYLSAKETTVPTLADVRVKDADKLTDEDKGILNAAKDQLTDVERDKFFPGDKAAADKAAADAKAKADADAAAAAAKKPAGVAASEGQTVTLSASELETLQANAKAGLEASEKLRRNEAEKEVTEMCFSENALKLPTDMKGEMTDLWLNASESEKATLKKVFEKTKPMLDANDQNERGSNEAGNGTAQDLLDEKANELMASEAGKNLDYSEAMKKARRQNPDLAKEADQEIERETPKLAAVR